MLVPLVLLVVRVLVVFGASVMLLAGCTDRIDMYDSAG